MNGKIIDFNYRKLKADIFKRFKEICGIFDNADIDIERKKEAIDIFEKAFYCYKLKGIYSFVEKNFFEDENRFYADIVKKNLNVNITGIAFFGVGAFFENIDYSSEKSMLEDFYVDVTGTAIIDVARGIFKQKLEKEILEDNKCNGKYISDAFGVGFFGIEHNRIFEIFDMANCCKIGLKINDSGVIEPDKSFVGFFAISNEIFSKINDCKDCIGSRYGCFLCEKNRLK